MRAEICLLLAFAAACTARQGKLIEQGSTKALRDRAAGEQRSARILRRPQVVIVAIDGVDRRLLYDLIDRGALPGMTRLLGGAGPDGARRLPHAYFEDRLLSVLPSSTIGGWTTLFTGVSPAEHGITGNELFIREQRRFFAPAPASIIDSHHVLGLYTDPLLDKAVAVPTLYETLRADEPGVLQWVSMGQLHRGADTLLLADKGIIQDEISAFLSSGGDLASKRKAYAALDERTIEEVIEALDAEQVPDVLTTYLPGTDLYAHHAELEPDRARTAYLVEVLDPALRELAARLERVRADRFVVVVSDHGHTDVIADDAHALALDEQQDPPAVLTGAGFRLRPFQLTVEDGDPGADFQAVLAYQGAMAYVYLADRSTCARPGQRCDWSRPPRYQEDVLAAADAFYRAGAEGRLAPGMAGTLDMVLARRPRPHAEDDLPFEVYVGNGRLEPLA